MISVVVEKSKHLHCEKTSCFVKFSFNPDVLAYIKSLPTRIYHPDDKMWEVPGSYLAELKENLHIDSMEIKEENNVEIGNIYYKTSPFEHQTEGVQYGMSHDKWLLADEQGLGKTKQAIDIAVNKKNYYGYEHCLIVCGVNSLKWNWQSEIGIHSDEGCHILGQHVNRKGKLVIDGNSAKLKDLQNIDELPFFLITNIETFRSPEIADLIKLYCNKKIHMIVLDEAHKCKNPTCQQTKGFIQTRCDVEIAMTGTPILNNPLDLYVSLKWLGYETHSFYSFQNHYCIKGGFGGYEIVGYKNMEELTAKVKSLMLRRLKKDVLDLPEKIYVSEYVDILPKQAKLYNDVKNEIMEDIDKVMLSPNPLASLIRLRQCTGYTGILSTEIQESAKLDRMEDLVYEVLSNGNKCLIFSNWTQITDEVQNRLKKYNTKIAVITGQTNDTDRKDEETKFMTDPEYQILVGTIGAMGTGLTLTAATTLIFMDEPWTKGAFEQAVDRAHRIGTKSNITIYSLLTKNTIDERIHNLIYKKGVISDELIDGQLTANKTEMINYLLS